MSEIYYVENSVKCAHCGVLIPFDKVSGNRFCPPCEAFLDERRRRGPATRLVVCQHCRGKGTYYEYTKVEPAVEPTAEQREAEHPNDTIENNLLMKRRRNKKGDNSE